MFSIKVNSTTVSGTKHLHGTQKQQIIPRLKIFFDIGGAVDVYKYLRVILF